MTIRVGFTLIDRRQWAGGYHYLLNLFRILRDCRKTGIQPVLFAGQDVSEGDLRAFRPLLMKENIVRSTVFNQNRKEKRLFQALLFGTDSRAEKLYRQNRIDVVFESAAYHGRKFPLPAVAWLPDFQHRLLPDMFGAIAYWKREIGFRAQIATAALIMLSSEAAKEDCERLYPAARGRISVVPFAVKIPQEAIPQNPNSVRIHYNLQEPFIYLPNQFWRHKNHGTVIEALKLLKDQGGNVVVAASGESRDPRHPGLYDQLKSAVRNYGLEKNFIFLGTIPYEHVLSLMQSCLAVVNPSLVEGWSTTVEEAKSLQARLILSDIAVHREQAGGIALFFEPTSASALAQALDKSASGFLPGPVSDSRIGTVTETGNRFEIFAGRFEAAMVAATGILAGDR